MLFSIVLDEGNSRHVSTSLLKRERHAPGRAVSPLIGSLGDERRKRIPATHGGRRREHRVVHIDGPVGKPPQDFFERDASFDSGQRRTQTGVDTSPKSDMGWTLPVNIEHLAVGITPM